MTEFQFVAMNPSVPISVTLCKQQSGPEYHRTGSTICWRYQAISHQHAGIPHFLSIYEGSRIGIKDSVESPVQLELMMEMANKTAIDAVISVSMEHKRMVSIGIWMLS